MAWISTLVFIIVLGSGTFDVFASSSAEPFLVGVNLADNELKSLKSDLHVAGQIDMKSVSMDISDNIVQDMDKLCQAMDSTGIPIGLFESARTSCYEHQLLMGFSSQSGLPIFSELSDDHFVTSGCDQKSRVKNVANGNRAANRRVGFGPSSHLQEEAIQAFVTIKRNVAVFYDSDMEALKYTSLMQAFPPGQMRLSKWTANSTESQLRGSIGDGVTTFVMDLSQKNTLIVLAKIATLKSSLSIPAYTRIYLLNQELAMDEIQAFASRDNEIHIIRLEAPSIGKGSSISVTLLGKYVTSAITATKSNAQLIKHPLCKNAESNWPISQTLIQAVRDSLTEKVGYRVSSTGKTCLNLAYSNQLIQSASVTTESKFDLFRGVHLSNIKDRKERQASVIKVTTILEEPFVMMSNKSDKGDVLKGNDRFSGFGIDIFKEVADAIGLKNYEISLVADGRYGSIDENGKWNGMIGDLQSGDKEIAIGPITVTSKRQEAVSFTHSFMDVQITALMKKSLPRVKSCMEFLSVFNSGVWLLIFIFYILVSVVIYFLGRISPCEWEHLGQPEASNTFLLSTCFWLTTVGTQSLSSPPRAASTRFLYTFWRLSLFFVLAIYAANVGNFIFAERNVQTIRSTEDLARQTQIPYGLLKGGSTNLRFKNSNYYPYNEMWNYISSNPSVFSKSSEEAVQRVRNGNYIFLMESPSADFYVSKYCELTRLEPLYGSNSYSFAFKKGSGYYEDFKTKLLELKGNQRLLELHRKWFLQRGSCGDKRDRNSGPFATTVGLDFMGGLFLLLFIAILVGVVLNLGEVLCWIHGKHGNNFGVYPSEIVGHLRKVFSRNQREVNNTDEKYTIVKPAPDENMEEINLQSTEKEEEKV